MNETFCNFPGKRDETIVAYLYGEMEADERALFDRHLIACAPCRAELADLRGVRSELARSAAPELPEHIPFDVAVPGFGAGSGKAARSIPVWAQAIAAALILGVAAGVANLDVTYSRTSGLSIRTGWRHPADSNSATTVAPALAVQTTSSTSAAPWKNDLTALERELRADIDRQPVAVQTVASSTDDAVLRKVRQLVQDSEKRQENELALRMAEAVRELQTQRYADLAKIDRTLGFMQNRTGMEVMRTQRQMNSLAQQVSQRP